MASRALELALIENVPSSWAHTIIIIVLVLHNILLARHI